MKLDDRTFKLWDYNVSHNQMLLRSPKTSTLPTNIDIVFVGVEYLELPTKIEGLTLVQPDAADRQRVVALGELAHGSEIFAIQARDCRHLVVAAAMRIYENDLDIFESSLEQFGVN